MSKIKDIFLFLLFTFALVLLPLFFAWWLFFPLSLFSAFFLSREYEALLAGFVLDILFYSSVYNFPLLTIFVLITLLLRLAFRDKLRF